jgi:hypothetical protein
MMRSGPTLRKAKQGEVRGVDIANFINGISCNFTKAEDNPVPLLANTASQRIESAAAVETPAQL